MAALENRPTCGNPTSENASVCPKCGEPFSPGWAAKIREKREQAEEINRLKVARKAARIRRFRVISLLLLAAVVVGPIYYGIQEDNRLEELRETDPQAYLAEVKPRIDELEAEVAKVPASDFDKNIRLYQKLLDLDPTNKRYEEKVQYYQEQRARAAAEKKQEEAQAAAKKKQEEVQAEAEKRRKGFHCLSQWDGSHPGVKKYVKEHLRDPDSFEHIETRITPVNDKGEHTLFMQFRARNGFGGMNVEMAVATISNATCAIKEISIIE